MRVRVYCLLEAPFEEDDLREVYAAEEENRMKVAMELAGAIPLTAWWIDEMWAERS